MGTRSQLCNDTETFGGRAASSQPLCPLRSPSCPRPPPAPPPRLRPEPRLRSRRWSAPAAGTLCPSACQSVSSSPGLGLSSSSSLELRFGHSLPPLPHLSLRKHLQVSKKATEPSCAGLAAPPASERRRRLTPTDQTANPGQVGSCPYPTPAPSPQRWPQTPTYSERAAAAPA